MSDIIGSIAPAPEAVLSELPAWTEPVRVIIIADQFGRRHGRIEWLASEVDAAFLAQAHILFLTATAAMAGTPIPSVAS